MQVLKQPWPGMLRTVYGNHARFESVYFKKFPGYYYTGDGTITIFFNERLLCVFIIGTVLRELLVNLNDASWMAR